LQALLAVLSFASSDGSAVVCEQCWQCCRLRAVLAVLSIASIAGSAVVCEHAKTLWQLQALLAVLSFASTQKHSGNCKRAKSFFAFAGLDQKGLKQQCVCYNRYFLVKLLRGAERPGKG
jgi:hypothetical protein